jgi:hypothetical protein
MESDVNMHFGFKGDLTKAETAVVSVMRRIVNSPRVAWLMGPGSQTYDDVTAAYAELIGRDVDEFRHEIERDLTFEKWK